MNLKTVLTVSAIYMALVGLGYLLSPVALSLGAVDASASAALMNYLRLPASTFLGIAVINWMARNSEASKARDAIAFGNTVGFGQAAVLSVWATLAGGSTLHLGLRRSDRAVSACVGLDCELTLPNVSAAINFN